MNLNNYTFNSFKDEIKKSMYLENLHDDLIEEYLNDWYILFKLQKHKDVIEFIEWQFPLSEVNENTHEFWKL